MGRSIQPSRTRRSRSIARSSARYSLRQYDRERFRELQTARGKTSGGEAPGGQHRGSRTVGGARREPANVVPVPWHWNHNR